MPEDVARCLYEAAVTGPAGLAKLRAEALRKYIKLADEYSKEEAELHASLHPSIRKVVQNKRVLLFAKMLKDCDFNDVAVAFLLVHGVRLV